MITVLTIIILIILLNTIFIIIAILVRAKKQLSTTKAILREHYVD